MKKILLFAIGILTSVNMLAGSVDKYPYYYQYKDKIYKYYYKLTYNDDNPDGNTAILTGVLDEDKNNQYAVIPSKITDGDGREYAVVGIGNSAFSGCTELRFLTLPETLKSIGQNAFSSCNNLRHIYSKVLDPSTNEFKPDNLPGNSDDFLVTLYVPEGMTSKYENYPGWSTKFPDRIFEGEMSEPIKASDGMFYVFAGVSKKATLYSGKNDKDPIVVGPTIRKPAGELYDVTGIDKQAFYDPSGFTNITSMTISDNITAIGPEAFSNCKSMEIIKLSKDLKTIKNNAFRNCSNLIRVESKADAFKIPSNLFSSANSYEKTLYVPNTDAYKEYDGWKTGFTYFMQGTIKEGITFTSPEGVTMRFICAEAPTGGTNEATLVQVDKTNAESITINYSFQGNDEKDYVVKVINKKAFANATSLEQLWFKDAEGENGVLSLKIGENALDGCSTLKILRLPERLDRIGKNAFSSCGNLNHIYFKNVPQKAEIGNNVFTDATKNKAYLYVSESYDNQILGWNSDHIKRCIDMEAFKDANEITYVGWEDTYGHKNAMLTKGTSVSYPSSFTITSRPTSTSSNVTYDVIAIGESAFKNVSSFENLTIPRTITAIGANAFYGCSNLKTVQLKASQITIDDNAFNGCRNLTVINLDEVQTIGTNSFYNCSSLEKIVLSPYLKRIGDNAFIGCNKLLEIENKRTDPIAIGSVFPDYDNMILYIPTNNKDLYKSKGWNFLNIFVGNRVENTVEDVNKNKLQCIYVTGEDIAILLKIKETNFTSVYIPDFINTDKKIELIARSAFENNYSLENVRIPNGVKRISKNAFKNCSRIQTVELPSELESIGESAFENSSLTSVIIPNKTTTVDKYAFKNCKLKEITLPSTLAYIGEGAFNCNNGTTDRNIIETITSKILEPFSLDDVFVAGLNPIIYIPVASEENDYKTKWGDYNYIKGEVIDRKDDNNKEYEMIYKCYIGNMNGAADGTDGTATFIKANMTGGETPITIPKTITVTNDENNHYSLTVTDIVEAAFLNNAYKEKIVSVNVEANIKSIGDNAFKGCTGLTTLTLPLSLTSIGKSAFQGCSNLESIGFNSDLTSPVLTSIGDYAFSGTKLTKLPSESIKTIGVGAFSNCKLNELRLDVVETIGANAFQGNSNLKNVWLPSTLTSIGSGAFGSCTNIANVCIQRESLLEIGADVFSITSKTSTLFVPNGMTDTYYTGGWVQFPNIVGGEFLGVFTGKEVDEESKNMTFSYYRVKNEGEASEGSDPEVSYTREAILTKSETTGKSVRVPEKIQAEELQPDGITKVWYNYDVVSLGSSSFATSRNLENLALVSGIKSIGKSAFENCSGLKTLEFPVTLASIGSGAFSSSDDIVKIVSDVVTAFNISNDVFTDKVYKNAELYVPDDDPDSYASESAGGWTNFVNVEKGKWVDSDYEGIFKYRYHTSKKDAIVTGIAFSGDGDTPLEIPSSVTIKGTKYYVNSISPTTFDNKDKVKTLIIKEKDWTSEDGVAKAGIEVIGINAFQNCTSLTKAVLPSSLVSIGDNAFSGCTVLSDVNFSQLSHLSSIGVSAFSRSNLSELRLPEGLSSIGANAFQNNSSLQNVWLPGLLQSIGESAFAGCGKIENFCIQSVTPLDIASNVFSINAVNTATLFVPKGSESSYYTGGWTIFCNVVGGEFVGVYPGSVGDEKDLTFSYYKVKDAVAEGSEQTYTRSAILTKSVSSRVDVNIPASIKAEELQPDGKKQWFDYNVTSIGASSFTTSRNLTNLTVPDGVVSIGKSAFSGFSSLAKVELPLSLSSIGDAAFAGSENIAEIISDMVSAFNISDDVFDSKVYNIATVYIQDGSKDSYLQADGWKNFVAGHFDEGKWQETAQAVNNLKYRYHTGKKKATVTAIEFPASETSLTIPGSIKFAENGPEYSVEEVSPSSFDNKDKVQTLTIGDGVKTISSGVFKDCKSLTSVVLPSSLTSISDNLFQGCSSLSSLSLPSTLTSIGNDAFQGCSSLTELPLSSVASIGANAFKGCTGLTSLSLPSTLATIGDNSFSGTNLATLTISEGLKSIGSGAFSGTKLTELRLPESVETIGTGAFQNNSSLKNVWLPSTLTSIGSGAFGSCTNIVNVSIQRESLLEIGADVFSITSKTSTLFVPNGMTETYYTGGWAQFPNIVGGEFLGVFTGKESDGDAKNMTFSYYRVKNVGNASEGNDTEVSYTRQAILTRSETTDKSVRVPDKIQAEELQPDGITKVWYNYDVVSLGSSSFATSRNLENLALVPGIKSIGKSAFENCSGLQTLELPLTLASIGSGAFSSSYDIVKIVSDVVTAFNISADVFTDKVYKNAELYVPDEGADSYASESAGGWNNFVNVEKGKWVDSDYEGIFKYRYHTSKKDAIVTGIAFSGDGDTPLEIPSSVEIKGTKYYVNSISPTTFDNKDKVKTLIIKDKDWTSEDGVAKSGIGVIGGNAFQNCTSLTKVVLPSSVVTIGDNAFQGCTNLQKLWLPATLTSIGSKAFNGCNLTRVTCETLPDIEGDVFSSYRNAYLFIPEGTTVKGRAGWGEFSKVYVGCYEGESISSDDKKSYLYLKQSDDSRTAILMKYENTDNIISPVEFEDNKYDVTIIAESACSGVTLDNDVLTLPNTIKEIEKKAFQNQRNLKSITLPSSLKTIGDYAFQGCSGLKTLELPTTLTSIGEGAFSGNTNVAEVTLPDNINTIGELAFQNCNSIKKIELPSTLTKIGANAFDGCNNLTEVISNITDETVITSNAPSMPNAILYVPNHKDLYESAGWGFAHIYEGKRVEKEIEGLYYAYAENADATNKEAVLVKVDSEKISEKVIIPNSIKDEKGYDYNVIAIDNYVFQGCTNLKTVELPSTLTAIGTGAFDGCSNLTDVVSNITDQGVIGQIALSLPNADLYVPDGTKAYYSSEESSWKFANYYVGSRIEVTVNGLNYVCATGDKNAFLVGVAENGIAEDGIVIIPASITVGEGETAKDYAVIAINDDAFSGNTNVKSVKVGDGIKTIGANAFLGCNNLSKVWLPVSLNEIGEKAFDGCRNIAYICTKQNAPIDIKNVFSSYNATLYVPNEEAKGNYEKDEFWNKFNNKKTGYLVDVTTQDNITYECVVNGDAATALLVKSESTATDVEIPSSVKLDDDTEYKVTTISKQTFKGNGNITTLRIGENVKTIEDEAFQNCGKLQKVWLPSTLESIGGKAFNGSRSITRISTKTKTLPTIGSDVLPENIAYLFIPEGTEFKDLVGWNSFAKVVEGHYVGDVTSDNISYICIESGSSADKTAMLVKAPKTASTFKTSVDLHEVSYALTTIGEAAFEDNTAFVNLVIPEGVKTIEANAFKNCSKLHSVVLPSTLEKIGDKAFKGSSIAFLQNYVEDPYEIADSVFTDGVYNNATLYVPENATDKYTSAGGWKNFKSVVGGIASEVTIEDMTYICVTGSEKRVAKLTKGSSKIKEVKVPAKLFTDDVKYQVTEIDKSAFEGNNSLEKVIVSEGIKTIGQSAFKQCSNLKSLVLPASLETVGDYAFDNCTRLATVTCAGEKPVDISDNVFSVTALEVNVPSRSAVKAFEEHKVWGSFDIYYSMTSSGDNGTTDADVATYQVITPEGDDAISIVAIVDGDNIPDDFSIPSVVEHNGVSYSVGAIAPSAFENKTSLKNVTIPGTVSWIGDAAFAGCSNLQSITVDNTEPPTQIGSSTVAGSRRMFTRGTEGSSIFEGVDVDKCILYVPEESIEKYKASTIWGVFKNIQAISATALDGITVTDDATFDVYNLQGRKVKSGVTTLKGLTPGVYIVKGKKVVLK